MKACKGRVRAHRVTTFIRIILADNPLWSESLQRVKGRTLQELTRRSSLMLQGHFPVVPSACSHRSKLSVRLPELYFPLLSICLNIKNLVPPTQKICVERTRVAFHLVLPPLFTKTSLFLPPSVRRPLQRLILAHYNGRSRLNLKLTHSTKPLRDHLPALFPCLLSPTQAL